MRSPHAADGPRWLEQAAASGHEGAKEAGGAVNRKSPTAQQDVLEALARSGDLDARCVAVCAVREALTDTDFIHLASCLKCVLALSPLMTPELSELVVATVNRARRENRTEIGIDPMRIEQCLSSRVARGDTEATFMLGKALCGVDRGSLPLSAIVNGPNMRRGAALLLRAADAGCDEAWAYLYRVHANDRTSVANPQMARFFLEKAASRGQSEAQRRLGALILKSATCLEESEQGIHWLHEAASQGDSDAMGLLKSLVLPLEGDDDEAEVAVEAVRREDPWLANRLRVSRDFGLTKLEALCVNPTEGLRPWGLVVGKNAFINQIKLSAPRAVPAISAAALVNLRKTAAFFEQARPDATGYEGELRRRSLRQRRIFERYRLSESMFFAEITSTKLDALRKGSKWRLRARHALELALAI